MLQIHRCLRLPEETTCNPVMEVREGGKRFESNSHQSHQLSRTQLTDEAADGLLHQATATKALSAAKLEAVHGLDEAALGAASSRRGRRLHATAQGGASGDQSDAAAAAFHLPQTVQHAPSSSPVTRATGDPRLRSAS